MMPICGKKISAEVQLIHAERMSLYNFIVLRNTIDTAEDWTTEARHYKIKGIYGFF